MTAHRANAWSVHSRLGLAAGMMLSGGCLRDVSGFALVTFRSTPGKSIQRQQRAKSTNVLPR
ncbi:uncharacterized protein BJX67DRAFT_345463 [Aspergillus lucknowensis]|uniref:Lipoprotein n=1 Tax=Aspergillus lucknowensis TaxID=176173 RepID=A0ABR4M2W6_9EURO